MRLIRGRLRRRKDEGDRESAADKYVEIDATELTACSPHLLGFGTSG